MAASVRCTVRSPPAAPLYQSDRPFDGTIMLTPAELSCLAGLQSTPVRVKRGSELVREGQTNHKPYILQAGGPAASSCCPTVDDR